jgi:hypothetical protein
VCAGLNAFSVELFPTLQLVSNGIAVVIKLYTVEDKLNWVLYIAYNSNKPQVELIYYL